MTKIRPRRVFPLLLAAVLPLFAAMTCGGQDGAAASPSPTAAASPAPTASPSASPAAATPSPKPTPAAPSPSQPADAGSSPQPIQVSQEVFTQTFSQVELLIKSLNDIIRRKDFPAWTRFLAPGYAERVTQADFLQQLNQSAILQKNNVTVKTLEDYFAYVVVPSRANLRLDDLVFLKETEVEAIMVVGNRRVTLYRLIKIGEQWMIGF